MTDSPKRAASRTPEAARSPKRRLPDSPEEGEVDDDEPGMISPTQAPKPESPPPAEPSPPPYKARSSIALPFKTKNKLRSLIETAAASTPSGTSLSERTSLPARPLEPHSYTRPPELEEKLQKSNGTSSRSSQSRKNGGGHHSSSSSSRHLDPRAAGLPSRPPPGADTYVPDYHDSRARSPVSSSRRDRKRDDRSYRRDYGRSRSRSRSLSPTGSQSSSHAKGKHRLPEKPAFSPPSRNYDIDRRQDEYRGSWYDDDRHYYSSRDDRRHRDSYHDYSRHRRSPDDRDSRRRSISPHQRRERERDRDRDRDRDWDRDRDRERERERGYDRDRDRDRRDRDRNRDHDRERGYTRPVSPQPPSYQPPAPRDEPPAPPRPSDGLLPEHGSVSFALKQAPHAPMHRQSPPSMSLPKDPAVLDRAEYSNSATAVVLPKRALPARRSRKEEERTYSRAFMGCGEREDYEMTTKLGEGTFGEVHKATQKATGRQVALKRILMHNEKEGMPVTALREIKILKAMHHPAIIELLDMFVVESNEREPMSVFMVFPYMDHDLAGLMENERVKLTPSQIKLYMKQLIEGTEYMHGIRILHRDMKAANLLISNDGTLRIADFGLARTYDPTLKVTYRHEKEEKRYTNCVVTRWYRPPELLLGARQYGGEVDMWGIGCVLGEMFWRKPILPGNTDTDQLFKIWDLCGTPNQQNWPRHDELPGFESMERAQAPKKRCIKQRFESIGIETVDLLEKLLTCNPQERYTASQALDHEYFWSEPLPADPATLPTYAASHEFDRRGRRHVAAPVNQPPGPQGPYPPQQGQPRGMYGAGLPNHGRPPPPPAGNGWPPPGPDSHSRPRGWERDQRDRSALPPRPSNGPPQRRDDFNNWNSRDRRESVPRRNEGLDYGS